MGSRASAPPPPDTTRFSEGQMDIARRSREFADQMWRYGQQQQQQLNDAASRFLGSAFPAMEDQFQWARDMRTRYETDVLPQVQSLFSEAETYASKAEEERQRGAAIQDVKSASQAEREAQLRKLESYGIDPSQTRYQALDKQAGVAEAALSALAANQAGERTKEIGRQLRREAIDVGTGFLNDAQNSYQMGTNMGIAATGAANQAALTGTQVGQGAIPYLSTEGGAINTGAGIVDQSYGRQLDYAQDQRDAESDMSGLMGLAGYGASFIPGVGPVISGAIKAGTGGAADGGVVRAPGGPTSDSGAIAISDGEYVIPADVVRKLGTNHFDKLIEKETGRMAPAPKAALPMRGVS